MIGLAIAILGGLALGAASVLGVLWRLGRAGPVAGFVRPLVRAGLWFALVVGLLTYAAVLTEWGLIAGFFGGMLLFGLLLGVDEFLDRVTPAFFACVRREVGSLFTTPIPYFVLFLFVTLSGVFFWAILKVTGILSLRIPLENVAQFGIFLFPLLTMGIFAREKAEGTVEVLMTAPVTDVSVVASKFLATLAFFLVMLLPTLVYFGVMKKFGVDLRVYKPDAGPVLTSYVGMALLGGFFISMGMFASSITSSQILAALLSWVFTILMLILEPLVGVFGLEGSDLGSALGYLSPLGSHMNAFLTGVIDPKDVVFFLSFILFFLFLSVRAVESRKWR